jgi:hypothetical protein
VARNAYLVVPFHERFRHRFAPPLPGHKKLETLLLFSAAVMGLSRLGYAAGVPELVEMKSWILRNNSALTSSGTEARPCGVISRTRSSTSIFSMPFVLMTSARAPQSAQVEQAAAWQANLRRLTDRRTHLCSGPSAHRATHSRRGSCAGTPSACGQRGSARRARRRTVMMMPCAHKPVSLLSGVCHTARLATLRTAPGRERRWVGTHRSFSPVSCSFWWMLSRTVAISARRPSPAPLLLAKRRCPLAIRSR